MTLSHGLPSNAGESNHCSEVLARVLHELADIVPAVRHFLILCAKSTTLKRMHAALKPNTARDLDKATMSLPTPSLTLHDAVVAPWRPVPACSSREPAAFTGSLRPKARLCDRLAVTAAMFINPIFKSKDEKPPMKPKYALCLEPC